MSVARHHFTRAGARSVTAASRLPPRSATPPVGRAFRNSVSPSGDGGARDGGGGMVAASSSGTLASMFNAANGMLDGARTIIGKSLDLAPTKRAMGTRCLHTDRHACTCTRECKYTCVRTRACVCVHFSCVHTCVYKLLVRAHARVHVRVHTYACICVYTHMYVCMHACMHVNILALAA